MDEGFRRKESCLLWVAWRDMFGPLPATWSLCEYLLKRLYRLMCIIKAIQLTTVIFEVNSAISDGQVQIR